MQDARMHNFPSAPMYVNASFYLDTRGAPVFHGDKTNVSWTS